MKKIIIAFLFILCISSDDISTIKYEILSKNNIINTSIEPIIPTISKKQNIEESVLDILNNYPSLKEIAQEANMKIPVIDGFIPQGITFVKENVFIVGYYDSQKNSKCFILNNSGEIINIVELDTNSHVGSIAYDEKRDLLWIPDNNGILNAYNSFDFFSNQSVKAKYKFDYISKGLTDFQDKTKNLIAYLCIDDDYLYVGNFFKNHNCTIKKYKIVSAKMKIKLKFITKFNVPKRTQSITFIVHNQKEYMILSQSYGRTNPSYLYVYEYNKNESKYNDTEIKKIEAPPMLEQISISKSSIYLLFESSASKYWNCPEKVEFVIPIKANKLFY